MYNMLADIIRDSEYIVFFGGAGVSTESDIPDFRSDDGLYNVQYMHGISPEDMISRSYFEHEPQKFYDYYKHNLVYLEAKPNEAHYALARLERQRKLKAIITQNIDGLHQMAGSKNVIELHGSVHRNYCMDCGKEYDAEYVVKAPGVPRCEECGGIVKPDVVLYEEELKQEYLDAAAAHIEKADTLIVGGSSLIVYPAAGLIERFKGKNLVIINKSATPFDRKASLVLRNPIGQVLAGAMNRL